MREKKSGKIFAAWFLAVLMLLSVCLPAGKAQAEEQKGSIELQLPKAEENLQMVLYKVAEYQDGQFVFLEDFADSGIQIADLNNAEEAQAAAKNLADFAQENGLEGQMAGQDEDGMVRFTDLAPALYLAAQYAGSEILSVQAALVPIPYMSESGSSVYDAVLSPKYSFSGGAVIVNKVDDDGNVVGDAHFVLQQKVMLAEGEAAPEGAETGSDESGSFYWKEFQENLVTSEHGQIVVTDMPIGDYRFVEVLAPDGFILNVEPAYFSITEAGQVAEVSGIYQQESGLVADVQVVNQQTSVKVNKVDEDGNPVSGARLVIKDAEGNVLRDEEGNARYDFVTTNEPQVLKRLPAGDYFLCEVVSPDGYLVAKDVPLTVSGTDPNAYEVTMVDEREENTPGTLRVTKRLVDMDDNEIAADEGVFYVALFEDEGLTSRVSDVKAMEFYGQSSSTVTFSNLKLDTTYYVSETDEFGNMLDMTEVRGVICMPMYPETVAITPTEQEPEHEFEFDNVFVEIPDGYYYTGRLTVTKEVLRGEEPYETDEVFYAGVFEDPEHTMLAMDVIPLEMDGSSEVSATINNIFIGENVTDTKTYYVCETDEDGIPLDDAEGLEFTVSLDTTEITFGDGQTEHSVVITNTYPEETPSPSVTPTVTPSEVTGTPAPTTTPAPGGNTPPSSHPGGSTPSTGVRTGDDTPIGMFVIILAVAVVVIGGIVVYRKKRS